MCGLLFLHPPPPFLRLAGVKPRPPSPAFACALGRSSQCPQSTGVFAPRPCHWLGCQVSDSDRSEGTSRQCRANVRSLPVRVVFHEVERNESKRRGQLGSQWKKVERRQPRFVRDIDRGVWADMSMLQATKLHPQDLSLAAFQEVVITPSCPSSPLQESTRLLTHVPLKGLRFPRILQNSRGMDS